MSKEDLEREIFGTAEKNKEHAEKIKRDFPQKVMQDFDKYRQEKGKVSFSIDGNRQ